jgi:hypothetical protein
MRQALSHPARVYIMERFIGDLTPAVQVAKMIGDLCHCPLNSFAAFKRVENAGLIQGEIEPPKIKYCINSENWEIAQKLFINFFK